MALRGSLKDFGIADVFSLIASQNKTGILNIVTREEQGALHWLEGSVVGSETTRRSRQELLGNMLVRAEMITETQLQEALATQRATRQRIGEILVESRAVSEADLQTLARLQTTEMVYRLFLRRHGTYEFIQSDFLPAEGHAPARADALLMEGFRQADEWPQIRRQINSYAMTFSLEVNLDEVLPQSAAKTSDDLDFDMGFGDAEKGAEETGERARWRSIQKNERLVYGLIQPDRDVQKLIDLGRLGEFDTCKALVHLIDARVITPHSARKPQASNEASVGGILEEQGLRKFRPVLGAQLALCLGAVVVWIAFLSCGLSSQLRPRGNAFFVDYSVAERLGRGALQQLDQALAIYHALHGTYPQLLDDLADEGLVHKRLLHYPWRQPYVYERQRDDRYILLPPLH